MAQSLRYADLGAEVYPSEVPGGTLDRLPQLYSSLFSTIDWFVTHDDAEPTGACLLDEPRHALVFFVKGDTVEILNKVIAIEARDVTRACRALFRALPGIRRVHLETNCDPDAIELPTRVLYWTDHMVVNLPATVEQYQASLTKRMRGLLRRSERELRAECSAPDTQVVIPGARAREYFEQLLAWKRQRFDELGRATYWDKDPKLVDRFVALLERCGEVHVTSVGGRAVSLLTVFPVGDGVCFQETAFDPEYERFRLGLLTQYWGICNAVSRGARHVNLLWGTTHYKERLGAAPVRMTTVSVFRSQISRLRSPREAGEVARRRLKRSKEHYWRARRRVGDLVKRRRRT